VLQARSYGIKMVSFRSIKDHIVGYAFFVLELCIRLVVDFVLVFSAPFWYVAERRFAGPKRQSKSILITGASSGIGRGLAILYSGPDIRLVLTGRNKERLEEVAYRCQAKGATVSTRVIDVSDEKEMTQMLLEADDEQPLDLVIANAGVSSSSMKASGQLKTRELKDTLRPLLEINCHGVFNSILPLVPRFRARKGGTFAIVSSVSGYVTYPDSCDYHASKVAVRFFGEGLRSLLASDNVNVCVIAPGFVRSAMTDSAGGKMPFFMETLPACEIIKKQLEANVGAISFPFPMYLAASIVGGFPDRIRDVIFRLFEKGKGKQLKLGAIPNQS